jgi:hypothetical protein
MSRLLELDDLRRHVGPFDPAALVYPWKHADPRLDELARQVQDLASAGDKLKRLRADTFTRIWGAAFEQRGQDGAAVLGTLPAMASRPAIPHFTEPWYCCAEPTRDQFVSISRASEPLAERDRFV